MDMFIDVYCMCECNNNSNNIEKFGTSIFLKKCENIRVRVIEGERELPNW